jgi:hypothetical protein
MSFQCLLNFVVQNLKISELMLNFFGALGAVLTPIRSFTDSSTRERSSVALFSACKIFGLASLGPSVGAVAGPATLLINRTMAAAAATGVGIFSLCFERWLIMSLRSGFVGID